MSEVRKTNKSRDLEKLAERTNRFLQGLYDRGKLTKEDFKRVMDLKSAARTDHDMVPNGLPPSHGQKNTTTSKEKDKGSKGNTQVLDEVAARSIAWAREHNVLAKGYVSTSDKVVDPFNDKLHRIINEVLDDTRHAEEAATRPHRTRRRGHTPASPMRT